LVINYWHFLQKTKDKLQSMEFDLSPLWISLKTSGIATCITFFIGIAVARWMLGYRGKSRALIDALLISPLVLPPTVVGFLLLLLLGSNSPLGQLLKQLGITIIFSWVAAVITATVVAFPLMYRTCLGAFEQIDPNILCAARTLGASEGMVFWRVTLPLAYRGIVAATILSFARALGEFGATLMLAGNIPGQTQTMPIAIFFAAEAGDMTQALVWVLIMLAISLCAIATVNFWSESQIGVRSQTTEYIRQNTPLGKQATDRNILLTPSSSLCVDIYKQLSSFPIALNLTAEGEALGILGASGSGKSMTLRCIAGLETPDRGHISLNGRVLFDSQLCINIPPCQRRIGFVFQNYALFPHLSVKQNIAFGVRNLPMTEQNCLVAAEISRMQLQGLENRYPHQLSGGQQQRVALARAMVTQPETLLLDEPLSALDTHLRSQMEKQLVETLATYDGVTLFVTHNLEEIYRVCKNLLVICDGKAIAYGDKQAIFARPANYAIAQITGCKNFSRAHAVSPYQIEAINWQCTLNIIEPIAESLAYVGIRAHQLMFSKNQNQENTFPCWLAQTSETPHRMTLYLKLHAPPTQPNDYHLQAELFKEQWAILKDTPFPWHISLDPLRLFLMTEN